MASEIRVDKINSLSGVGTVTLSPTGVDIAGITTAATLRATTGIVTSLTSGSLTSLGAVSGTTGTFTSSLTINTTTDQMLNLNSTDDGGTYIGYQRSGTRTAYLGHGGTGSTFTLRNEIENGSVDIRGNDGGSYVTMLNLNTGDGGTATFSSDLIIPDKIVHSGDTNTAIRFPEADTITFEASGNEQVRINNDVQMFVQANSKQSKLQLHREDVSINADDVVGQITFTGRDSGGAGIQRVGAAISAIASNAWDTGQTTGYSATHLDFYTQAQQSAYSTLTPRVRIDSSGRVLIGTTDVGGGNADDLTVATSGNTGITIRSGTSNTGNIFWSDATSGADQYVGALEYHHSDNKFKFNISNTTRMTVDSTGDVTVSDGDLIIGTAGHGISFDGFDAGGVSNLLDDYEEGTFTPSFGFNLANFNGSYSAQGGRYTKIGNLVSISMQIEATKGTGTGGTATIYNIPFTPINEDNARASGSVGFYNGFTCTRPIVILVEQNQTQFPLRHSGSSQATSIGASDMASSFRIYISVTYFTA